MDTSGQPVDRPLHPTGWRRGLRIFAGTIALIGWAAVVLIFLWRRADTGGLQAWADFKQEMKARGESVTWSDFTPPPVPDDQNVFAATKMQSWFMGRGATELSRLLDGSSLHDFARARHFNCVAEFTVAPADAPIDADAWDLVLRYDRPLVHLDRAEPQVTKISTRGSDVLPYIQVDNTPLTQAIKLLAKQAGWSYVIDPDSGLPAPGVNAAAAADRMANGHWSDTTARAALCDLLGDHGLAVVPGGGANNIRIVKSDAVRGLGTADRDVQDAMSMAVRNYLQQSTNGLSDHALSGPQSLVFTADPLNPVRPARILIRADLLPGPNEVREFFRNDLLAWLSHGYVQLNVQPEATNRFQAYLSPPPLCSAADYLEWSDRFATNFELIRAALRRPAARLMGTYTNTTSVPIPNFVALRTAGQTLAQRAECLLLLNRPTEALREMTLLHDMARLTASDPGHPATILAAVLRAGLVRLHVDVVAEGLRLHAWREPQLAALQPQLAQAGLPRTLADSFRFERACLCQTLTSQDLRDIAPLYFSHYRGNVPKNWREAIQDPAYLSLKFISSNLVCRNLITISRVTQGFIDACDTTNHVIQPGLVQETSREMSRLKDHFAPTSFLAALVHLDYASLTTTIAQDQSLADEAKVACALERFRLANGLYPETLAELTPTLLDKIPNDVIGGQPLKYRRTDDGQFVLYGVGWDETDDGGKAALQDDNHPLLYARGDWVWPHFSAK